MAFKKSIRKKIMKEIKSGVPYGKIQKDYNVSQGTLSNWKNTKRKTAITNAKTGLMSSIIKNDNDFLNEENTRIKEELAIKTNELVKIKVLIADGVLSGELVGLCK